MMGHGVISLPDSDPPPVFTMEAPPAKPTRVACKIRGKKRLNVFLDDWGFPDQSREFDVILHNIQGDPILQKCKHAAPPIDKINPQFHSYYNKARLGQKLRSKLDLSHLDNVVWDLVYKLLQRYYLVFDNKEQFIPVKDCKC